MPGAPAQRCRVYFMRNALARVGKKDRPIVTATLRTAFDQDMLAASKDQWAKLIDAFDPHHPKLADLMRRAEDDILAHQSFQQEHWPKSTPRIRSSASTKRSNAEPTWSAYSQLKLPSPASVGP
ncbi:hypothetical protein DKT77_13345 [Meridianimarinicoccus roseus]|uniref:Mutator family transposase n=1 Tax=Meridianimarinicoccus roseus TaxID=2072018 RepID=A0A2V2LJX0_9RHOB|nr:hypothetical protein DKT77_13345 [Meridianimarinicoccus roseus]